MLILELDKEEGLWNVMSEIHKNRNEKKATFKRLPELFEVSGK